MALFWKLECERQDRQTRGLPGHDEEEQLHAQVQDRQTLRHPPDAEGEAPRLESGAEPHAGRHSVDDWRFEKFTLQYIKYSFDFIIAFFCVLGRIRLSWTSGFRSYCPCNDSKHLLTVSEL